ncbi:MAG: AMP-dependent synthetase [Ilumatobacter coccineus]|uniref:AMP-dependent synthetase n=1 Tax=Ilumatobacter coccineus TaxID=467094 RepID=A0A2G6K856_9ACTN|nr:MAG: AMP-dependent synthetase [Ilumatobacter coccineus]
MIDHLNAAWTELSSEGSMFAISTTTVRGIPMRVFTNAPPTLRAMWDMTRAFDANPYVVFEDETYTYGEIDAAVRSFAHYLRDTCGIAEGGRVAIAMRNYPEWVIAYWATTTIGASVVGMNAWWTTSEMRFGIVDSEATVIVADDERLERLFPVLDEIRGIRPLHVVAVRSDRELPDDAVYWSDVVTPETAPDQLPAATIDPDDDATIFYTSGTTGTPKGAQLTHRGSVHNVMNLLFMTVVNELAEAKAVEAGDLDKPTVAATEPGSTLVFMAPTPMFHVTANNCVFHPATVTGGKVVFMHKWDTARALELIEREGVTNFSGVPTMSRELLLHPDWERRDTSTIRGMGGGGAALQPDLVGKIDEALANGGPSTGYGLTETCGIATANIRTAYLDRPDSAGRFVPTLDARLIEPDGTVLEPGPDVVGEVCVRGPVVIKGYLNRPRETADAIQDGWFRTGDIGRIDEDGFLYIVDRSKDMVIRGGENVYCNEVEAAIYQHPDVTEAAVFGLPDDRLGEKVAAVIVTAPGSSLDEASLADFLSKDLAKFKIPEQVWFRTDQLPRNANGKFLKRELRDQIIKTSSDQART